MANRDGLIDHYLDALEIEFSWQTNRSKVATIFVGGGTPSRLSAEQFRRLFDLVADSFDVHSDAEITIECNPDDINNDFYQSLRDVGANRISLGVQSFDDAKLKFLERDHSRQQIENAIEWAGKYFDNFSIDLIFATQGEQLENWLSDLRWAISHRPNHISTYELTIEKGTQFWNSQLHGSLVVPDEDRRAELYEATIETLTGAGFDHYEISSFARSGSRCRHNLTYWNGSEYLAFGASAARYVNSIRETNHRSASTYMKRVHSGESPVFESDSIAPRNRILERVAFGLRQLDGVCLKQIWRDVEMLDTGFKSNFKALLERLDSHKLVTINEKLCRLTRRGLLVYDSIASEILSLSL